MPIEEEVFEEVRSVRPYTFTQGRTRSSGKDLALEALVVANPDQSPVHRPHEQAEIIRLCTGQPQSVAELSAHVHLPLGVVRVLVSDLAHEGVVKVHEGQSSNRVSLDLLGSVLDGINAL